MTSPILSYEFNTSDIGADSSGSGLHLTANNVDLVSDAQFGPVASFNGTTSYLVLPSSSVPSQLMGSSSRTYTWWMKQEGVTSTYSPVFHNGQYTTNKTGLLVGVAYNQAIVLDPGIHSMSSSIFASFPLTSWRHLAVIVDTTNPRVEFQVWVDGGRRLKVDYSDSYNEITFQAGDFLIGKRTTNSNIFEGVMSGFKVYDQVLPGSEIVNLFNNPPVPPAIIIEERSINIPVVIQEVTGATEYEITYEGPTGGEIVAFSGSTDLTYNIVGVEPTTQYKIKLYAHTGTGLELVEELATTTLPNVAANYDITDFQEDGVTDLTSLDATALANITSVITELVNTGDAVSVSLPSNPELTTSFVDLGETISITGIDGVLLPFDDSSGAGQTVSLTLSDNITTVPIVYDEVGNTITIESVTHSTGDIFVLDGNAVEVFDYYGLTVVSIDAILTIETRSINIPVVIGEFPPGATSYNITIEGPTGGEITALSGVTTLEHNITGLDPETQYTVKLYADTGAGYVLTEELTTTTLPNVTSNYDITDFQEDNGVTDLTSLDATTLSNLSGVITELVSTGDVVNVSLPNEPDLATSFVAVGETVSIASIDGILLPFDENSGAGQTVDLTLSDTTVVPVTYDEVNNTITVETVAYSDGDAIYLDGDKLEVFDYYGLTVVSVNVAPLLVEPGPINIPVVITEVPGAVYKISYVGPDGVEKTSLSGVATLAQNITGLVSDTEYTIKLYADTGSGYVLTEELTTMTLPNVAANYDVDHLVKDGVINLSSLPENSVSNLGEVMNELFSTGDIVNVSVQGKPGLNTSFIKLGESLSIQELNGVLLPFVGSSGAGQGINVVLSDGNTNVSVDYDDTANSITVNGVAYYPGDSFVLDGQKVTVVEY